MSSNIQYEFGDFRLDVGNEKLYKNGESVILAQKAFLILCLLIENSHQLVKKETIYQEIWQNRFVEDANISQQIYILRKILGNNADGSPLIETLPKRGYIFTGEVIKIDRTPNQTAEPEFASESKKEDFNEFHPQIGKTSSLQKKYLYKYGSIVIILAAIIGGIFMFRSGKVKTETGISSIAVLPFKDINGDDESKLGFGLADSVINNLSKQRKLQVRSISAVFHYAEKESFDPLAAGRELGVDSVLEGTVQRQDDQVRISLRLLKISDGSTVWAETFNERSGRFFALQDSISAKVAQSLSINLPEFNKTSLQQQTANSEAAQYYQLGLYYANTHTKDGLERAVVYFQKAIELDPNYALAYAMLADTFNWINQYWGDEKGFGLIDKSEIASQRALSLDDSLAEAYIARSYVHFVKYKDYDKGKNDLAQAIQLSPNNPFAHLHFGWELLRRGDLENSYLQMKLAQEYSPLTAHNNITLCNLLMYKRDYPEALRYCRKSAELQPTTQYVNIQIANLLFLNGKPDEAINLLEIESGNASQKYESLGSLAYIYARTGKPDEAEKIYQQLKTSPDSFNKFSNLTLIAYTLGKKNEARRYFQKMMESAEIIPTYLIFDPFWEEFFKDEEFKKLSSKILITKS